jgi:hypothetical protein
MLHLDHVFCMVPPDGDWAARLAAAGWALDAGTAHAGQGTRNRRLVLARQHLELAWVQDEAVARGNQLRLDRRANWRRTGASPFGIGLRGRLPEERQADYRPYEGLPIRVWVHKDDERAPERPLVFVLEVDERGAPPGRPPDAARAHLGELLAVRHTGPAAPDLPQYEGPAVHSVAGPHSLEIVVDRGRIVTVTDILAIAT